MDSGNKIFVGFRHPFIWQCSLRRRTSSHGSWLMVLTAISWTNEAIPHCIMPLALATQTAPLHFCKVIALQHKDKLTRSTLKVSTSHEVFPIAVLAL